MAKRKSSKAAHLSDQEQRDLILTALDDNMLVEAAAGTGKTTIMVERMVALVREAKCRIGEMAAVTFTRKAAAELRARFQLALETATREASGKAKARLEDALAHIERCFIGTIHSFCAQLLRERPVEAGVSVAFEELDEAADERLRKEAWDDYTARLLVDDSEGILGELSGVGLRPADLEKAFMKFGDYPDVEEWPAPSAGRQPGNLDKAVKEFREYADHMRTLAPLLPRDPGTDTLIPEYKRLPRVLSHNPDLTSQIVVADILERFRSRKVTQKEWKKTGNFTGEDAKTELARWNDFRARVAEPYLTAWYEARYGTVMKVMHRAKQVYDDARQVQGVLNYQDLLMKAAGLLCNRPHVREYFRKRFTHLLVDEFQDTDPIQAQVMLFLTATNPKQKNWRKCKPRPGSLFVVGDPKQSIFRFRRADIVTYKTAKSIIGKHGKVVRLQANFRATSGLVDWVNGVFEKEFPEEETDESPGYVALEATRAAGEADLSGVRAIAVPKKLPEGVTNAVEYDAELIARFIRDALDRGLTVSRIEHGTDRPGPATPDDFLIITYRRNMLSVYSEKLQKYGIPHQVTGGSTLNEVQELKLLHTCLTAVVHPDNPVLLVGALRSELFGISDAALYAFEKAGGSFSYNEAVPAGLSEDDREAFTDAFSRLKKCSRLLAKLPLVTAVEEVAADMGLAAAAAAKAGGDVQAGSFAKAIEILRNIQGEMWTAAQLLDYLGQLVQSEEKYDGISARSDETPTVRIMNLHKAKGLEAPVVFLACPGGKSRHEVTLHVDRSAGKAQGYVAIRVPAGPRHSKPVATPEKWKELQEKEQRFLDAEETRLLYVAATRACAMLVITRRPKESKSDPWRCFAPNLKQAPRLQMPDAQPGLPKKEIQVTRREVAAAQEAIVNRLSKARKATWDAQPAKQYALSRPAVGVSVGVPEVEEIQAASFLHAGEHGAEWGAVIHSLLQSAMKNNDANLSRLARVLLSEHDLDVRLAEAAVETVRSAIQSNIWKRAEESGERLLEVPFQVLHEDGGRELPVVLRGAIDLAFHEDDGWVLVDYKTDAVEDTKGLQALAGKYAPQLQLYADAWRKCTGEPVKETGLYFCRARAFVPVGKPGGGARG